LNIHPQSWKVTSCTKEDWFSIHSKFPKSFIKSDLLITPGSKWQKVLYDSYAIRSRFSLKPLWVAFVRWPESVERTKTCYWFSATRTMKREVIRFPIYTTRHREVPWWRSVMLVFEKPPGRSCLAWNVSNPRNTPLHLEAEIEQGE
jgi:hypothetical protein